MISPRTYPIAAHLQTFGKRPLSTVLLERDALAYGLRTHRFGSLAVTASDTSGATVAFSRTGSMLNSGTAAPMTRNKHTTRLLLEAAGAPAPQGRRFGLGDFETAAKYVDTMGSPVVFKPLQGTEGKGVVTNINTHEELKWAFRNFERVSNASEDVLIEEHLDGETYRVITISGEVVSVLISRRGSVVGDGRRTVRELIEERQQLRNGNPHLLGRPIPVDDRTEHLLQRQGVRLESILGEGEKVDFTFGSNTHQGGEPAQVMGEVHPTILRACELAARSIPGLNFAGFDFIIPDISKPLSEQRAGICEINSVPAADSHEFPLYGPSVPVARLLLEESTRIKGLRLHRPYATELTVDMTAFGTVGSDYASWLIDTAQRVECDLAVLSVDAGSVNFRVSGQTDNVGVFASLAFTGTRGTVVRSLVSRP